MKIVPIGIKAANEYVAAHHRHHKPVRGCKFCVSVEDENGECCGVAICGRPVSRYLDDGTTLEINRVCTNGTRNVCSMLYGACVRAAKALGYKKVITYTLASETGASLKARNFINEGRSCLQGEAGGTIWTGERRRDNGVPAEKKVRWVYNIG